MTYQRDLNVNIRRQPNVGGVILLALLGWWIFSGYLPSIFDAAYQHGVDDFDGLMSSPADGYGSVSYVLITMLWQAVGGLLTWAAIAWGVIQFAIRDVLECCTRIASDVADRWKADSEIEQAVITEHVKTVSQQPATKTFEDMTSTEQIKAVARDSQSRIKAVETKVDAGFDELKALIAESVKPKPASRRKTTPKKTTPAKTETTE